MGKISIITGCFLLFSSVHLYAAQLWTDNNVSISSISPKSSTIKPYKNRRVSADLLSIRQVLSSSVNTRAKGISVGIDIPLPDGTTEKFSVEETRIMEQPLADKYPEIKTYKVRGIDTPSSSGRVQIMPGGFHAYINTDKGLVYIDPVNASNQDSVVDYTSYYKKDFSEANVHLAKGFSCGAKPDQKSLTGITSLQSDVSQQPTRLLAKTTGGLKTYRLAVATTEEYSARVVVVDGAKTPMQQIVISIDRVNVIFERDLAIQLILVANNNLLIDAVIESDGVGGVKTLETLLDENQSVIDTSIGDANYDVGHLFATVGGGLAGISNVCFENFKAQGASGLPTPLGIHFDIDIVAHELGHQFGADHSYNGTEEFCGDARNQATAFEPGSGNTIMAYAGICSGENIQTFADANFHAGSIDEIVSYTRLGSGRFCSGSLPSANASPSVNAGPDVVIPLGTPFTLSAVSAIDPESDPLSFQWQQMDTGAATDATTFGRDLGTNPLFKSFPPVSADSRTFPQMSTLLASVTDPAEVLPTIARTMNFRLLVKDGNGGVDDDNIKVRVTGVAGPFKILQPNTSSTLDIAETQVVEWDSSCTDQAPVSCANVDILFSADGGNNFTALVSSTPNDGDESVIFPQTTTGARLKIMCTDNIFFDLSDVNFTIDNVASGNKLDLTGVGGNSDECVAEPVPRRGGAVSVLFLMSFALLAMFRVANRRY